MITGAYTAVTSIDAGLTLAVAAVVAAPLLGCVAMEEVAPERGDLFAPLHDADLSSFEYQLAIDRHTGRDDGWTDVGDALLQLANCEPISRDEAPELETDSEPRLLVEMVRLEDQRRLRLYRRGLDADDGQWPQETIHTRWGRRDFFERRAPDVDTDELLQWPERGERWPDEWPARIDVEHRCEELEQRVPVDDVRPPFDALEDDSISALLVEEWLQTQWVRKAIDEVDETSRLHRRARWTVTAHRADIAFALRQRQDAVEVAEDAVDDMALRTLGELREIAADDDDKLDDDTRVALSHRAARLAIELGDTDAALSALDDLLEYADGNLVDMARYYATKLTWQDGRWSEAADYGSEMIDAPQPVESAYAYFAATAHRHDGREDSFLGMARQALRDHRRHADDPFLGALYRQVLRELTRYEVDERTEELLEEFGPRAELWTRMREFAKIALDMGRPEVAEYMVDLLADQTHDARRIPQLRAILALAAFMRDDRDDFEGHIEALIDRPDELLQAVPRSRRAAFFAHRDAELARVLRATLPLMAEWGDGPGIEATRQLWLEVIVDQTQNFLRNVPESVVSNELVELYELAGQLLEDHPRGYAERVGRQESTASALVLGTVDMPPAPPLEDAPRPRIRWAPVSSLLLIPRGTVPPDEFVTVLDAAYGGEQPQ